MFSRAVGQLLPQGRGLLRQGGHFLPLLFGQFRAVRGFCLLELCCFLAGLAQLRPPQSHLCCVAASSLHSTARRMRSSSNT